MRILNRLHNRWTRPNGYRHVFAISLPLVASMGTITLMQFTDRVFLANYSVEAITAALPAGILSFTLISFFMGVAGYTNSFVAQYTGAQALDRVGAAVWQGIYFSFFAACFLALFYFFSQQLFDLIGHSADVRALEIAYFNILTLGAGLVVLSSALSCFYTGRGLTWTVMWVHLAGAALNIPLDYCLINGVGPFPALGIVGAAIATVSASALINLIFILLIFSRYNRETFGTWKNRRFRTGSFRPSDALRSTQRRAVLPGNIRFRILYSDTGTSGKPRACHHKHRIIDRIDCLFARLRIPYR